jgi:hypothetical protein
MTAFRGREVTQEPPLLQAVRKVICDKWMGADDGCRFISTADLTVWVNQELGNAGATVSKHKIGKAAAKLGLVSNHTNKGNGYNIRTEDVVKFTANIAKSEQVNFSELIKNGKFTGSTPCDCRESEQVNKVNFDSRVIIKSEVGDFFSDYPEYSENIEESPK